MNNMVRGSALVLTLLLLVSTASATDMINRVGAAHDPVSNTYLVARAGDTQNLEVYRVDAAGTMLGSKISLKDGSIHSPDVAWDSETGRFLLLWSESVYSGVTDVYSIRGRFLTTAGATDGDEITFVDSLTDQPNARLEYSAHTERFFIAYRTRTAIRGQFVAANGTLDGTAFDVIPGDTVSGFQYTLNVEAKLDPLHDRFLVVGTFHGSGSYPPLRMFGAIIDDADPVTFTAERFTVLASPTYIYPPALAFDTVNERFLVAFEVYTGSGHLVEGVRVNADGTLEGDVVTIHDGRTAAFATAVTYKPADGRFLVVWLDDRGNSGVFLYGREVNPDGTLYATEFLVASPSYQFDLALTHNPVDDNTLVNYGGYQQDHFLITPPPLVADLEVTFSAPAQVLGGESMQFTVSAENLSADAAPDAVLTIGFPTSTSFLGASSSHGLLAIDGRTLTCTIDSLASGAEAVLTIEIIPHVLGDFTVTAAIESGAIDPVAANDTASKTMRAMSNLVVSLPQITSGIEVEIRGENLGEKKGTVRLVSEDGKKKSLKILSWNEGDSGVIRAVLKKAPRSGSYSLMVKPKGGEEVIETDAVEVVDPIIQQYPSKVYGTQELGLTGHWFGAKKGKLYLEYEKNGKTKRKTLKVLAWPETSAAGGQEGGEVRFRLPKKLPIGPAKLVVRTKAGECGVSIECREEG